MGSNFAPEMPRINKNIFLLALTMLSFGLQISGSEVQFSSNSATLSVRQDNPVVISITEVYEFVSSNGIQSKDQRPFVTEIGEEVGEINSNSQTNGSIAASHAYFTSFLVFGSNKLKSTFQYFDASSLVSSIPIYLEHEVFRL